MMVKEDLMKEVDNYLKKQERSELICYYYLSIEDLVFSLSVTVVVVVVVVHCGSTISFLSFLQYLETSVHLHYSLDTSEDYFVLRFSSFVLLPSLLPPSIDSLHQ